MSAFLDRVCDLEVLRSAWRRVRANDAPPGIDRVSCDDFEKDVENRLAELRSQLHSGTYRPLPVVTFKRRRKAGKSRILGVPTVRDRIVQQALAMVLSPRFESVFLPCCYAYRPGRSALQAVQQARRLIRSGCLWALQMDIKDFFERIDHGILRRMLEEATGEAPLVRLVGRLLKARILREMGFEDHLTGTHQGSGLSPLLSNIYLHPLDRAMWRENRDRYLRYSDDLTVFAPEKESLEKARARIEALLAGLKLEAHPNKTVLSHLNEGIVYLGYHLDSTGIGPSRKSVETFVARLRVFDKVRITDEVEEKVAEATAMVRGWGAYFRSFTGLEPPNPVTVLALFRILIQDGATRQARILLKSHNRLDYRHPELGMGLADAFTSLGMSSHAMRHYARVLELDPDHVRAKEKVRGLQETCGSDYETIEQLQMMLQHHPDWREGYQRLRDAYLRLGLYGFAHKAHDKALELDSESEPGASWPQEPDEGREPPPEASFDPRTVDQELFLEIFRGRREAHAKQWVDERGKWGFQRVDRSLKKRDVHKHLNGEQTLAVYPVSLLDTVRFIVFDIDTAKKVILKTGRQSLAIYRRQAHQDALRLKNACAQQGARLYIEDSGYKGRHGWLFFDREVPARDAIELGRSIMKAAGEPSRSMVWELYPRGKSMRHKSLIKIPLGIDRKSNRRCLFLRDDGVAVVDQGLLLKTLERYCWAKPAGGKSTGVTGAGDPAPKPPGDSDRGPPSTALAYMVERCRVLRHLVSKARDTQYLTHFERVCLLYTLTFAGSEGVEFLHRVIGYCINYNRAYTQRQVNRRKQSPMSCAKIAELFPELAEGLPCDCRHQPPPRGYPSPVLYLVEYEVSQAGPKESAKPDEPSEAPQEEVEKGVDPVPEAAAGQTKDHEVVLDFAGIFAEESGETEDETIGDSPPSHCDPATETERDPEKDPQPQVEPGREKAQSPGTQDPVSPMDIDSAVMDYLRARQAATDSNRRLEKAAAELDKIFRALETDSVPTAMGTVTWRRRTDGSHTLEIRTED